MKKNKNAKKSGGRGMVLRPGGGFSPFLPTPVSLGLREAERLLNRNEGQAALHSLEALNRRYPGHAPVLEMLLVGAIALEDSAHCLVALEGLQRIRPDDPQVAFLLPTIYMISGLPALSIRAMQHLEDLLGRGKGFSSTQRTEAETLLQAKEEMKEALFADLATAGLEGESGFEIAWRTEAQREQLQQSNFAAVKTLADEMIALRPDYAPALNNLAQAEWLRGDLPAAVAACQKVLEFAPDNVHALANLARFQFVRGEAEEARKTAMVLKISTADAADRSLKIMEALVCLGEDKAVLDVFNSTFPGEMVKLERDGKKKWLVKVSDTELPPVEDAAALETFFAQTNEKALQYHLAAVSALRLGRENAARGLWRRALEIDPDIEHAKENLVNMDLPVGERNGPWAYSMGYWLSQSTLLGLKEEGDNLKQSHGRRRSSPPEHTTLGLVQQLIERFPQLLNALPILLDQGDPNGREFALRLAAEADLPEAAALLRAFALGTKGSDQMRMQAAQAAVQAGLIEAGNVRMYLRGTWQETILLAFEITGEPSESSHAPHVQRLLEQGMNAYHAGDKVKAERLLREAVQKEPNSPALWNNLAGAIAEQGRIAESEEIIKKVFKDHPDYFFARTNMALLHLRCGELEPVRELLDPLLRLKKLHMTEFASLVMAQVKLQLAEKSIEGAQSWLDMLAATDMEAPQLENLRKEIEMHQLRAAMEQLISKVGTRKPRKKKTVPEENPEEKA